MANANRDLNKAKAANNNDVYTQQDIMVAALAAWLDEKGV